MQKPRLLTLLAGACLIAGCAAQTPARRAWVSTGHLDHPLVGQVLETSTGRLVGMDELERAVQRTDFVLLGEMHDNPDHHLLQAQLLRATIEAGQRRTLAFEMLDLSQQPAVDAVLQGPGMADPDQLARAVGWAQSGWPDFSLYRPLFEVALDNGLEIAAANLAREQVRAAVRRGELALDPAVRESLLRQGPMPEPLLSALRQELRDSHCGMLPEAMIDPMVLGQRARDAIMALRLLEAERGQGAVLIAGFGHVRRDRGVPALLAADAPSRSVLAVALVEVSPAATTPAEQAARFGGGPIPFDYVVFTPAMQRPDPCEALRRHAPSIGPPAAAD